MYRIVNGLYGFIIGDALGVPVEFNYRFVLEKNPVKDMREYGSHGQPKGTWSDDTSMMLATMDSIIDNKGYNVKDSFYDMANKFVSWYKESKYTPHNEVFDMGRATRTALNNYINKKDKLCGCGEISDNGNGSLMRILPLAYYFWVSNIDILDRKNIVFDVSSITHSHIISKYGCIIYVEFVLNILKNQKYCDLLKIYLETIKQVNELLKTEEIENRKIIEKTYRNVLNGKIHKEKYENIKSSGYVVDTLEAVLWAILNTNNFDDAVLKAVNLGDDTDTIGALTGGIAGTYYDKTNEEWFEKLQAKEYLDDLIKSFIETLKKMKRENHKFDLKLLEETINDLKYNPKACEIIGGEEKNGVYTLPASSPGKQLSRFIHYMYDEDLIDKNYLENEKKIADKDIGKMNFDEIITKITFFLRGERFCNCFWYSNFKDGTILKLLERLKEIKNTDKTNIDSLYKEKESDIEIRGFDNFQKKYYFKQKDNMLYLLSEDNEIMNLREINENEITTSKGSLFFELTGENDVTAFSALMSAKICYKVTNVQKLVFISERTAEYLLSNISESQKTIIKNDLDNLFLNKELQMKYNFVLLHPICFEIDENRKVATYIRLKDINDKILKSLNEPKIEAFDFSKYVINVENKKDNSLFSNIEVVLGDITEMNVDVIVNAANKTLLGGGGVDGAIHQKAGIELYNACKELGGCNTGDAKITDGYKLNVKKIIHTVAPIWNNENIEENKRLLKQCYETSYKLAKETRLETIAFPCLGMGVYQVPLEVGAYISLNSAICNCMDFKKIYLVCYGKKEFDYYCTLLEVMKQS